MVCRHSPPSGMIDPRYLAVLRQLSNRLGQTGINWAVTGSCGFALQGVPVVPNDIDIQTDSSGAYEIERLFSEHVTRRVQLSTAGRIRSHYGALGIDSIQVEIMGGVQKRLADRTWEPPVDIALHKRSVVVDGMNIPVLSLEYELEAYKLLGRTERAGLLGKHLRAGKRASS